MIQSVSIQISKSMDPESKLDDLSDNRVEVTLIGKVLDLNYARLLASDGSLTLEEIMLLDCVQKQQPLTADQIASLRSKQLIEGRKPNFFIAKSVAYVVSWFMFVDTSNADVAYGVDAASFDFYEIYNEKLNFIKE